MPGFGRTWGAISPKRSFGDFGIGEGFAYESYAIAQYSKAKLGYSLSSLGAETIPSAMQESASNTAGAYLKAAYWVSTATRMAIARKMPTTNMLTAAGSFLGKGDIKLASGILDYLNPVFLFGSQPSQDPAAIAAVFMQAYAFAAPIPEVAAVLQGLASQASISARQTKVAADPWAQPIQNLPGTISSGLVPSWKSLGAGVAVAAVALVVVAVLEREKLESAGRKAYTIGKHVAKTGAGAAEKAAPLLLL